MCFHAQEFSMALSLYSKTSLVRTQLDRKPRLIVFFWKSRHSVLCFLTWTTSARSNTALSKFPLDRSIFLIPWPFQQLPRSNFWPWWPRGNLGGEGNGWNRGERERQREREKDTGWNRGYACIDHLGIKLIFISLIAVVHVFLPCHQLQLASYKPLLLSSW